MNFRGTARPLTEALRSNPFAHWAARMFTIAELRHMLERGKNNQQCVEWGLKRDEWRDAVQIALAFSEGW